MHQFVLKLKVAMSVHSCFHHLESIEIVVVVGVVNLKVVKALLVVSHFRDIFMINSHARQVFLNMAEDQKNLSIKHSSIFLFLTHSSSWLKCSTNSCFLVSLLTISLLGWWGPRFWIVGFASKTNITRRNVDFLYILLRKRKMKWRNPFHKHGHAQM